MTTQSADGYDLVIRGGRVLDPLERAVGDVADGPEGMVQGDPLLQRHIAEHRPRPFIGTAHRHAPFENVRGIVVRRDHCVDPMEVTFSAPC